MIAGDLPDWIFPTIASFPERIILSAATAPYYAASAFILYFFIRYIMEYLQLTGRAKKSLPDLRYGFVWHTNRVCTHKSFHRFHLLCNSGWLSERTFVPDFRSLCHCFSICFYGIDHYLPRKIA